MYFVYIIKCKDGSLYTGITTDLERRFLEHKRGLGGAYTRAHPIARVVFSEKRESRGSALRREAEIKSLSRREKLQLIKIRSQQVSIS